MELRQKNFDIRSESLVSRAMWLTSLKNASRKAGENTLMVTLEDNIGVSRLYFQGLLAMINAYGRNRGCRDKNLMGFSLIPTKMEELRKPFPLWNSSKTLGDRSRNIMYVSVIPNSWGVAYWSDHLQEFAIFVDHRLSPPFINLEEEAGDGNYDNLQPSLKAPQIPDSRSKLRPDSWKRFLTDFMYGRGLIMLYPSFSGEEAFAATFQLQGEHVSGTKNPRIAPFIKDFHLSEIGELPKYRDLVVFGLHLEHTSREELTLQGARFLHTIRTNCGRYCQDLFRHWTHPEMTRVSLGSASPQICAADLYMPASTNSETANHLPPKEKYLLIEPSYGENNQFYAIVEALYWASILDRILIVPPIFLTRVRDFDSSIPFEEWPDTESVVEFGTLDNITREKHTNMNLPLPDKNKPIGF